MEGQMVRMAEMQCPHHEDHVTRIKSLEKDVERLDNRVTELDKSTAVNTKELTMAIKSLSRLPDILQSIEKSMYKMQGEIEKSNERMERMETDLSELGNKVACVQAEGNISIIGTLKKYWYLIIITAYLIWERFVKGV